MEKDDDCLRATTHMGNGPYEMLGLLSWALWRQEQGSSELPTMLGDGRYRYHQAVEYILDWAEKYPEKARWS